MQFLVECGIQILDEEAFGCLETGQCHLGGAPVTAAHDICPSRSYLPESQPDDHSTEKNQHQCEPISCTAHKEHGPELVRRLFRADISDIFTEILHILSVRKRHLH